MERESAERRKDLPTCCYSNQMHYVKDFSVFDYLRRRFYKKDGSNQQQVVLFLCGATAGISSLTLTTPL